MTDHRVKGATEGVKNSMTLGLTDPSPWADNKGEPRAWHNLKYLWHTFEIQKNPKGNQNTSARVILEDTRVNGKSTLQGNVLSITFGITQEDSYKEKTSTSRRRGQPTTIKAPIPSQIKVRMIYPL